MGRIRRALYELHALERMSGEDRWVNRLHPAAKLAVTLLFLILTVSFGKYDLSGLLGMFIYPLFMFIAGEIRFRDAVKRIWPVLLLLLLMGAANPFFDREPVLTAGTVRITGGMISMTTLFLKGVLCVLAAYILTASTSITGVCGALRMIKVPKNVVTVILLIYRYLSVLLGEADRVTSAYALRAPSEKGVGIRAWGSLAGSLLIRSMDRAQVLYDSMQIRGYTGEFREYRAKDDAAGRRTGSLLFLTVWTVLLLILRFCPVAAAAGKLVHGFGL